MEPEFKFFPAIAIRFFLQIDDNVMNNFCDSQLVWLIAISITVQPRC